MTYRSDVTAQSLGCARTDFAKRVQVALCIVYILNVLGVYSVAMYSCNFFGWRGSGVPGVLRLSNLMLAESTLMLLPGLLLGAILSPISPRCGIIVGTVGMAAVLPTYYIDFLMNRVFQLRLLSAKTWELVFLVLGRAGEFTLQTNLLTLFAPCVLYLVAQALFLQLGWWTSGRPWPNLHRVAWRACAVASVLFLLLGAVRVITAPQMAIAFLPAKDPHPIHLTGLLDKRNPRTFSELDRRCVAQLVTTFGRWEDVEQGYRDLSPSPGHGQRPDVTLFIMESLRHDAITAAAAPNLTKLAEESLVSSSHFSTGNATPLGYFGIMYGLNAIWYERAVERNVPPALPSLMRKMGYYTVFLGSWNVKAWGGMEHFLNDRQFDHFEILPLGTSFVEGDRAVLDRADAVFSRTGSFRKLRDRPLFVVLQLNTTHYEFHSEPEDQIFQPANMKLPPWGPVERPTVANRYANSVRCVDRLIAPLLDRKRILLVTGDHGESFGEDGLYLHSSALTQVQLQTPLMLYVPGRPSRRMHEPTCHTDILPTLMHAIDGLIDEPRFLHGRSLLDSTIELSNRVLIASNRDGFEYAAIEFDAETNQPHSPYHFVGDPFLADFHLLGYGSLQDGSLVSDKVDEQHFGRVFHRMIDQLVAGSSPDLPEDATASLRQSRDHGEVRTRVMALSKLHLLDQVQRHRQDPQ